MYLIEPQSNDTSRLDLQKHGTQMTIDFPWSQDVKNDLDLGRPRATSDFQRGHTASRLEYKFCEIKFYAFS